MIRVLAITDTDRAYYWVQEALANENEMELIGRASNPAEAVEALASGKPDAVVVDAAIGEMDMVAVTQDLVVRGFGAPIVALTIEGDMERARQLILAGARSFVTIPLRDGELARTLHQVVELENIRRIQSSANGSTPVSRKRDATLLAVYSPKGGVGCTMISTNLAVALQLITGQTVALVDAARQLGHVGLVMNLRAPHTLPDLLPHLAELEPDLMQRILAEHVSGVNVLLASPQPDKDRRVSPDAIRTILGVLAEMFDLIVVDVPKALDDYSLAVLEMATRVLLVVIPEVPAIRDAKIFLETYERTGYSEKIDLVLNRSSGEHGVKLSEIETALKHKSITQIPDDPSLVPFSMNRGVPLVQSHQRSPVGKSILLLAQRVTAGQVEAVPVPAPEPVQVNRRAAPPPLRGLYHVK